MSDSDLMIYYHDNYVITVTRTHARLSRLSCPGERDAYSQDLLRIHSLPPTHSQSARDTRTHAHHISHGVPSAEARVAWLGLHAARDGLADVARRGSHAARDGHGGYGSALTLCGGCGSALTLVPHNHFNYFILAPHTKY